MDCASCFANVEKAGQKVRPAAFEMREAGIDVIDLEESQAFVFREFIGNETLLPISFLCHLTNLFE